MKTNLDSLGALTAGSFLAIPMPATFLAALLAMSAVLPARAATTTWSGGGVSQDWSLDGAGGNWTGSAAPGSADDVKFFDPGADPFQGNINNIVDVSRAIRSLQYANSNSFHTTLIGPGQTLTVANGFTAGTGTSNGAAFTLTATVTGSGVLSLTGGNLSAVQADATAGAHQATLDFTGLDTFTGMPGRVLVGVGSSSLRRAMGTVVLAKTNNLTLTGANPQLLVGDNVGNNNGNSSVSLLGLGQTNALFIDTITVGGQKQRGTVSFGLSWPDPTLLLRGTNGASSRVNTIAVGDNGSQSASGNPTTGVVDLSAGTADILANTVYLGRGQSGAGNTAGPATGTMTVGAGTLDVNTLEVGYQSLAGALGVATGTMNVNFNPSLGTNATLVVNTNLRLARFTGTGSISAGTLNITGGAVRANAITNGGGTTAISLSGGVLTVTNSGGFIGTIESPIGTFNLGDSVLELSASNVATNVVVTILTTLSSTNNTINIASLPVITSYPAQYPLISYASLNFFDFLPGTLPPASPAYQGYISNNFANSTVDLVITGGPALSRALTWRGAPNGDWDTTSADWLAAGSPTLYNQNDAVLFDDTASGTTTVNLTMSLTPFSLTVSNATKSYTFTGTGGLNGSPGLIKRGAATLTVGNSGANGFGGGITIDGGRLQISGSDNRLPTNSAVTLADAATAMVDLNNLNQTIGSLSGGGPAGGNVALGSGTLTLGSGSGTHDGVIGGAGAVVKNGSGTQVFTGANLYTGGTVVSAGTLVVANVTGSGSGAGSVTVGTNATFALGSGGPGGSISAGTLTNNGTVSFNRSDDFTLASVIVGNGAVAKNNSNIVVIPISNTYTGATTISAGALRISNAGALGDATGATVIQNDPTAHLEILGGITLAEPLGIAQKQSAAGSAPCLVNLGGTNALTGNLSLNAGGSFWTFEVAAGRLIVSGTATNTTASNTRSIWLRGAGEGLWNSAIADGGVAGAITALRKDDPGIWTLSGNNSYTGPTVVSNGTLRVNGVIGGGINSVSVQGGTLGGTGTIRVPVTIAAAGTLAPGASLGTLTISNDLALSGTTVMEVSHASADRVTGLTNVSFGGTLQVIVNGTLNGGEIFKLFEAQSYSGDFTVYDLPPLSDPLSWNTNSLPLDGTLKVAGGIVPLSFNPEVQRDGASLIFRGSGGKSPGSYYILSSTNLNLPLTNWTRVTTNQFDSNGSFIFTNIVKPAVPAEFFQIQLP